MKVFDKFQRYFTAMKEIYYDKDLSNQEKGNTEQPAYRVLPDIKLFVSEKLSRKVFRIDLGQNNRLSVCNDNPVLTFSIHIIFPQENYLHQKSHHRIDSGY